MASEQKEVELFAAALDLEASQRLDYLDRACGDNLELRNRLRRYVQAHEGSSGPLDQRPAEMTSALADLVANYQVGDQMGLYKLLEQIGVGGMGVVFMAEQREPIRRTVALKIIKPGMDSAQVIARFEAERQALALMNHPNIAKVLDAGTTKTGLPYFVMELVKGIPVTEYCDEHRLDTRQRLDLFITVCHAVQHAHQKGLIHRDLKPSNVLVELHDVHPVPKVIDFGVAKATNQSLTERTLHTGFSQMIGTPTYMSPEQAQLSGLDVDTRSDVYSLGVILYELLTGETPFDRDTLRQVGFDEMRRIIREDEPLRPSHRVNTLSAKESSTVSERRRTDPRKLSATVRGELDWIVMKSLEKDRIRRYESASQMAADIQRYLDGEPVEACPRSFWYGISKTLARNRGFVIATSAVLLSLSVGLGLALWQLNRANQAEASIADALNQTRHQRDIAEARLAFAETAINDMYTEVAQKWLSQQPGLKQVQREFLEKALVAYEQLSKIDDSDPVPRMATVAALGRVATINATLGHSEKSVAAFQRCIDAAERRLRIDPDERVTQISLARAQSGLSRVFAGIGKPSEKLEWGKKATETLLQIDYAGLTDHGMLDMYCAAARHLSGALTPEVSMKVEAEKVASLCVDAGRLLVERMPENQEYQNTLAHCLRVQGTQLLWWGLDNQQCAKVFEESLALYEATISKDPDNFDFQDDFPVLLQNLAVIYWRLDRHAEIEPINDRRVEILESLAERFPDVPNNQEMLANALRSKGIGLAGKGKHSEKDAIFDKMTRIAKQGAERFPDRVRAHLVLLNCLHTVGEDLRETGKRDESRRAFKEMRNIAEEANRRFPNSADVYFRWVVAYWLPALMSLHDEDYHSAHELLRKLKEIIPAQQAALKQMENRLQPETIFNWAIESYHLEKFYELAINLAIDDNTLSPENRASVLHELRESKEFWTVYSLELTEAWSASVLDSESPLGEVVRDMDIHGPEASAYLADRRIEAISATTVKLEADTESDVIKVIAIESMFSNLASEFKENDYHGRDLAGFSLLASSLPRFSQDPSLPGWFADQYLMESPNDDVGKQAKAWADFRMGEFDRCRQCLNSLPFRENHENDMIRAICEFKSGDTQEAMRLYRSGSDWLMGEAKSLGRLTSQDPGASRPSFRALSRLQLEAGQLLEVDSSMSPIPSVQ